MSSYGFDDDLPEINLPKPKPKRPKPEPDVMKQAVEAGRAIGFVSRDPVTAEAPPKRKGGRRPSKEPQDKMFISGPRRVTDAFRYYCERHDMSYWEALDHLLEKAGD